MSSSRFVRALLLGAAVAALAATTAAVDFGLYTLVLDSGLIKCTFNKSLELDVSLLTIYKYDFENDLNSSYFLNTSATEILDETDFDPNRTTVLFIPGFSDTVTSGNSDIVRENVKNFTNSYLYIVDASNYTYRDGLDYIGSYERSVKYYYDIGRAIAEFLAQLTEGGVNSERILVVGHSLGGQIAGAVGEAYVNITGSRLPIIVGADPAGPCFTTADKEYQLRSGLADRVYTFHCDKGQLGTVNDYADASFNANGGEEQPGCRTLPIQEVILDALTSSCSHNGCVTITTLPALLPMLWPALKCDSASHYNSGKCAGNETAHAGFLGDRTANGTYYFVTTGFTDFKST